MKKKIITLMLSLSTMCLLGGCGQETDTAKKQEETVTLQADTTPIGDETDSGITASESADNTDAINKDTSTKDSANTSVSAEAPTETKEEPQIPKYDGSNFADISIVAEALGLSFTPVENFSNGFLFSSFTVDKTNALILNYKKDNPDDFLKNQSIMLTFTPEEYIYDPKFDEVRALENATIEDTTVKVRLYTHYNCEGDWRSLMTEQELEDLFALFDSGVAGGGETNLDAEAFIEISEKYTLRWQQNGAFWVCLQNNPRAPKAASFEDLETIITEFIKFNKQ